MGKIKDLSELQFQRASSGPKPRKARVVKKTKKKEEQDIEKIITKSWMLRELYNAYMEVRPLRDHKSMNSKREYLKEIIALLKLKEETVEQKPTLIIINDINEVIKKSNKKTK